MGQAKVSPMSANLKVVQPHEAVAAKKPPVDPSTLEHRQLLEGAFWQKNPRLP